MIGVYLRMGFVQMLRVCVYWEIDSCIFFIVDVILRNRFEKIVIMIYFINNMLVIDD